MTLLFHTCCETLHRSGGGRMKVHERTTVVGGWLATVCPPQPWRDRCSCWSAARVYWQSPVKVSESLAKHSTTSLTVLLIMSNEVSFDIKHWRVSYTLLRQWSWLDKLTCWAASEPAPSYKRSIIHTCWTRTGPHRNCCTKCIKCDRLS